MSNSSSFSSRLQQARPGSLYRSLPSCGINRDTRTNFVESLNSASMDMSVQETVHNLDRDASRGLGRSRNFSSDVNQMPEVPPRRGGHRRAHSETAFHLPDDVMFDMDPEFADFDMPTVSDDTAEELISMYMDTEKDIAAGDSSKTAARDETTLLVRGSDDSEVPRRSRSLSIDASLSRIRNKDEIAGTGSVGAGGSRPRHRHSNSMDDSTSWQSNHITSEQLDTKKTMAADKLAELALIDPKRAKRILANRQSAIRSKERKMRYISELERKVQTLQTEATTLSAQLTMLQRDTSGLTNENNELKLKLQAMEQQAQLREALNEALREKVQRLKILTGEVVSKSADTYGIIPSGQQPTLNHPYIPQGQQSDHIRNQFQSFPHSLETISHASIPGQAQLHPNFQYEGQFQSGFPVEPQASSSSVSHPSAASF